jgi:hypothetical protein
MLQHGSDLQFGSLLVSNFLTVFINSKFNGFQKFETSSENSKFNGFEKFEKSSEKIQISKIRYKFEI